MVLGDLLSQLSDRSIAAETLLNLGDLKLVAALRERAATEGVELGTIVALAVRRYAERASDEEWVTLMGELSRSADPGRTLIQRAVGATLWET